MRDHINALTPKSDELTAAKLDTIECGYIDFGTRRRNDLGQYVQLGCTVTHRKDTFSPGNVGTVGSARIDYIPAAEEPELDQTWPELMRLQKSGDTCPVDDSLIPTSGPTAILN